jgi:hypothetical protein
VSVISNLVVKLTTDTSGFQKGFGKADKTVSKWGKVHKVAVAGAAAGLGAFAVVAKKSMDTYNDFGKTIMQASRMTNSSTEDISMLVGQWKRYGIEGSKGVTALKFLNKNIDAARQGNKLAIDSFARLGISMEDLQNKSTAQILMQTRDALAQTTDTAARTALTLKFLGRSGTEMLAWVVKTPEEIAAVNKKLKELGLVWGDKEIKTFKDMAGAQKEMGLVMFAFQLKVAQSLVPALTKLLDIGQKLWMRLLPFAPMLKWVALGFVGLLVAGKVATAFNALAAATARLGLGKLIGQSRILSGVLGSTAGKLGLVGAAVAATSYAVYRAVDAWKQYRDAAKQATKAASDALALAKKLEGTKYEKGFARLAKKGTGTSLADIQKQIERDRYKKPWWDPSSWFAKGGDFMARKPMVIGVGERPERVTITPQVGALAGRPQAAAGAVHQTIVNLSWQTLTSTPSVRELEALKRELATVNVGGY